MLFSIRFWSDEYNIPPTSYFAPEPAGGCWGGGGTGKVEAASTRWRGLQLKKTIQIGGVCLISGR